MAIHRYVVRDKTEAVTPPTVDSVTPIEGGVILVWNDATDMVRYLFYIILRNATNASGTYEEGWDVLAATGGAVATGGTLNISEVVLGNGTDLILIPPRTAQSHTSVGAGIPLGNLAPDAITDNHILNAVLNMDGTFKGAAIGNEFSPDVTRTVFRSDVMNATIGPSIRAVF